ncbi:hypothetical protein SKAU_G00155460 [Synaphobranchus kaupii]|uniref:Alkylated DNA repair protein AlkB homologue 8 N-terminal domain-containing protein n=1 Tax=Synaphobranchus kaupii TaxID=118154 RepID=A0A9Q1FHK2_SYNKA|nr:hypothetical protein SKAU_G00155460 [Synaphobranchus kaupii]
MSDALHTSRAGLRALERSLQQSPLPRILTYADDTTIVGLISRDNEAAYRQEVERTVAWRKENDLVLNAKKTNKIIINFRTKKSTNTPILINNEPIPITDFSSKLNSNHLIKKAQQRLYFLRQLKKLRVEKGLLVQFYKAIVQSILTNIPSITVWYANTPQHTIKDMDRIISRAAKITGCKLPTLGSIHT